MRDHPATKDRRRWNRLRRRMFDEVGWRCRECGKAGRLELDHIKPVHQGGSWWDEGNLQVLCRGCHFEKTAAENSRPSSPERRAWQALLLH